MTKKLIIDVDGVEMVYGLPSNWDEVTVDQAIMLDKIKMEQPEITEDMPFSTQVALKHKAVNKYFGEIVKVFHPDFDKEYISMIPYESLTDVIKLFDFIKEEMNGTTPEFITIEGEDYYLKTDFNKLMVNEIINLDIIQSKYGDNFVDSIPEMLCLFLRKKLPNGKLEMFRDSHMDRANMFGKVPVGSVANMFVFFLDGKQTSQKSMKVSSQKQKERNEIDSEN